MTMELTPINSPVYTMKDIKKQNQRFRAMVRREAKKMELQKLIDYVGLTQDLLNNTESISVGLTERARLSILKDVLADRMDAK